MASTIAVIVLIILVISFILWLFAGEQFSYFDALCVTLSITFWIGIMYIMGHFVIKYW